jgi:hypothetical protein
MKGKTILLIAILLWLAIGCITAQTLPSLPVQSYDYHIAANIISPIALGMGGINLTNPADYFTSYDNPALLAENTSTAFATSFRFSRQSDLSFADVLSASNLLQEKQFMYYTLITKNAAWSYQPVSSTTVSRRYTSGLYNYLEYYDYQLDKLQLTIAATDDKRTKLSGGLNIKYLTGRLVYLKERGNDMERVAFIDNKAKGVSGDLGLAWTSDKVTWGLCMYDILSRLWWEDYDSEALQRRAALGFQYSADNLNLMASVQGKMSNSPSTTYHLGLVKNWTWQTASKKQQNLLLRAGLFSRDFNGTDNIHFTLGSGYNYSMFRIDFALTNTGMQLRDSEYIFSVGVGI